MTREEFSRYRFSSADKVEYMGDVYDIASLNFGEDLVGIKYFPEDNEFVYWVRCENVNIVK